MYGKRTKMHARIKRKSLKDEHPSDLSLKSTYKEKQTGSTVTISEPPQSLLSLKGIGNPLQIGAFAKRNWTPASIRIVSKLVSSYGGGEESRTPVRKYFLKDFSGRSHLIDIPSAARQMTGLLL